MKLEKHARLSVTTAVIYALEVLDSKGNTVKAYKPKRNLVLDQGLNMMATVRPFALTNTAVVGTGTDPVKRDSGSTTFTRSGSTVTASGNFFSAADVGRLLKFDSGEEMYLTAYTDPQNMTSNISGALAASEGTVWYVNQLGLQTESKRTQTLISGSGNNTRTYGGSGLWNLKRTFVFSAEASPVTYNEIGWSNTLSAGANLFGRDVISPGVSLLTGQQLKVTVTLQYTVGPVVATAFVNPITGGFGADGTYNIQSVQLDDTGTCSDISQVMLPCETAPGIQLSPSTTALTSPAIQAGNAIVLESGSYNNARQSDSNVTGSYVTGSFQKTFTANWSINAGNGTTLRSFGTGGGFAGGSQWQTTFRGLWPSNQTKDSVHTLSMVFTTTWGRTLVN